MTIQAAVKGPADALRWRYATKQFDSSKKIPSDVWQEIEEAVRLTPSSYGLQPWKFVVVTDQSVKEKLVAACMGQAQPRDCSHFVVISRLDKLTPEHIDAYVADTAKKRGATLESLDGFKKMLNGFASSKTPEWMEQWMARQCYIALGMLMMSASFLGVDNGGMEGFDPAKVDEVLDLPSKGLRSVVCCALGYRHADDKYGKLAKVRFDASQVFVHI